MTMRRQRRVIAVLAVVALGVWGWDGFLKDRLIAKRWGVVVPGAVYRSGQISESLIKPMLEKNGIRVVVDLTGVEADSPRQEAENRACEELGIEHLRFPLSGDGTGNITNYALALSAVRKAQAESKPVLVHCAAGSQRAGAAVYFYRTLIEQKSSDIAYEEMQEYDMRPSHDQALVDYINGNIAGLGGLLQQMGVVTQVPASALQPLER
jgi:protein tyrosine/serine phosphatase